MHHHNPGRLVLVNHYNFRTLTQTLILMLMGLRAIVPSVRPANHAGPPAVPSKFLKQRGSVPATAFIHTGMDDVNG